MFKSMFGEDLLVVSHAIVIVAVAFVAAASIAYYQFFYVPERAANIANPPSTTIIRIVEGTSLESNSEFMVPKIANLTLGINNRVSFINEDYTPHIIISDTNYKDPVSGEFNALTQVDGGWLMPGRTFNFTFTEPGEYGYHHEPHPWVHGMIIVK
jgi:plastocyanin